MFVEVGSNVILMQYEILSHVKGLHHKIFIPRKQMIFSLYIVTYKNEDLLQRCLDSALVSTSGLEPNDTLCITVINNYDVLNLPDKYANKVTVINNFGRPKFSTGHLSRSWNQCILHGIENINKPKCDVLILAQNDVVFKPDYIASIKKALEMSYNYIALGRGDEVQIMTPDSIKRIGLYDERFCNIGFQESDYFLRAVLLNPTKTSINDVFHERTHNALPDTLQILEQVDCGYLRGDESHMSSCKYHLVSKRMFAYKWMGLLPFSKSPQIGVPDDMHIRYPYEAWDSYVKSVPLCAKQYIMYPYFECELPDLEEKYVNYSNFYDNE